MSDQLEPRLREALSQRAAQLDPDSIARLRAIDYHPRRRRISRLPAISALGATGVAANSTGRVRSSTGRLGICSLGSRRVPSCSTRWGA